MAFSSSEEFETVTVTVICGTFPYALPECPPPQVARSNTQRFVMGEWGISKAIVGMRAFLFLTILPW
jgi:hypothetical protein